MIVAIVFFHMIHRLDSPPFEFCRIFVSILASLTPRDSALIINAESKAAPKVNAIPLNLVNFNAELPLGHFTIKSF